MNASRPSLIWRLLPAVLFGLAASALVFVGWRSLAAERAVAEDTCRTRLAALATDGAARIAAAVTEATGKAVRGEIAARVDPDGRFLWPRESIERQRLGAIAGGSARVALALVEAERVEVSGDLPRAREIYASVASDEGDLDARAAALFRWQALERRDGQDEAARSLLTQLVDTLAPPVADTWEAMFARAALARPDDRALRDDLLLGLGTADEPIALGLLRDCGLADDASVAARRDDLSVLDRVRPLIPTARASTSGARFRDAADADIVAWWTDADGTLRFAEQPLPPLPGGTTLVSAAEAPHREDLLVADIPTAIDGWHVVATQSRREVDAVANQRRLQFAAVLGLLLASGGAALWLMHRAARREAEAVRVRSQFITRVGHDLRTPLTLIRMYAETLAAGKVTDAGQAREFAGIAMREAERLSKLVAKVLDFSRGGLENDRPVDHRPIDVNELTAAVVLAHRPAFEQLGIAVTVLGAADSVPHVVGDRDALRGALGNLLENVLHHAAGGRQLEARVATHDGVVELQVLDRGPGLPAAVRDRLFERFVRGPDATSTGIGLGLALVREIAEAHGGSVRAEDRDGGGAAFTIVLPRREGAPS